MYSDMYISSKLVAVRKQSFNVTVHAELPSESGANKALFELSVYDPDMASTKVTEKLESMTMRVYENTTIGTLMARLEVRDNIFSYNGRYIASLGTK